jgi:hypothetical protein
VAKVGTSKAGGTISQQAAVSGRQWKQTNKKKQLYFLALINCMYSKILIL